MQEQFLHMASLLNKINTQDHLLLSLHSTQSHKDDSFEGNLARNTTLLIRLQRNYM